MYSVGTMDSARGNQFETLTSEVAGEYVFESGETWYRVSNCHLMSDFFVCPVSAGDHWMFVSRRGALSAGRRNPDVALFPYYCSDKLLDMSESTGPKTIIRIATGLTQFKLWEPFAATGRLQPGVRQNFYKNDLGNRLILEETNDNLQLSFRYQWEFSNRFGFVRTSQLLNIGSGHQDVSFVDGLQNILPSGLGRDFQSRYSNLGDAYKKNELLEASQLGLYYLSSIPTDRAEPSEGLRATTVWQHGLASPHILLSSIQLDRFRLGLPLFVENSIRARRGAYFVSTEWRLAPAEPVKWKIVANVEQDQTDVSNLSHQIFNSAASLLERDVAENSKQLLATVSSADGRQLGGNRLRIHRHQSNVLFNVMRGGRPFDGYRIDASDLCSHVSRFNTGVAQRHKNLLQTLPERIHLTQLHGLVNETEDNEFIRIVSEYLPLTFSRRHGDPTRPWNSFSIELQNADGSQKLGYEGNWRDIFQNWEALALSYPDYLRGMVLKFVNASTADGYNPYRLSKDGFEWEAPEPNDPWANIGYWGDHQIIYLLKLMEWSRKFSPTHLTELLPQQVCAYAQVPYRIRPYQQIVKNAQDTIEYDYALAIEIEARVAELGFDGCLLQSEAGGVLRATFFEKLLVPILARLANFVPEGGVWLNTQRPEWNDANNALVGRGLSMVTTCYLRRFVLFMDKWLAEENVPECFDVCDQVVTLLRRTQSVIVEHSAAFAGPMSDQQRKQIVDGLSLAGCEYRAELYRNGLKETKCELSKFDCRQFLSQCLSMIDHTIRMNRRDDGLFHSYNLLTLTDDAAEVKHLYEMLEGQVAVLSSGLLSAEQAVEVLDALRGSRMYRDDQQSYMLYPDRILPTFLQKNIIAAEKVQSCELLQALLNNADTSIIRADVNGEFHFNGDFRNASDLAAALDLLKRQGRFSSLIDRDRAAVLDIYEATFQHADFTGRSGTFFAYEGLGSIYWHMVSKLALATIENVVDAKTDLSCPGLIARLIRHYREIRDGLGLEKTPLQYGAIPSDPYSHTPQHAGAQQPGMTGQVKEDILCRYSELGVQIDQGQLRFAPDLFEDSEFLGEDEVFRFYDLHDSQIDYPMSSGEFGFTVCQVPVIYHRSAETRLVIHCENIESLERSDLVLTLAESQSLFSRSGIIARIDVFFCPVSNT